MAKELKVAYVEHPVTADQKAELRADGCRIVDARFAPEGAEIISFDDDEEGFTPEAIDKMKKSDVAELLETHGVDVDGSVAEMRERLKSVMFAEL